MQVAAVQLVLSVHWQVELLEPRVAEKEQKRILPSLIFELRRFVWLCENRGQ